MSNAPSKPVSFSRPKVGYFSNRPRIHRVYQEESTLHRENVSYVKLYRYNNKYLYPKLHGYGENGEINFEGLELLQIC